MKKFATLALAGLITLGNFGMVQAAAPAPAKAPTAFNTISFENGEAVNWKVTGSNATKEVVTTNATQGVNALKVNMTARETADAKNITKLVATPPAGTVWNIGAGNSLSASITNPGTELIQIRATVKDAKGNARMAYFSIAPGLSKDIVLDAERLGTPGVSTQLWKGDGYSGKGVDPSCITSIEFYFSETEAVVMKGITSASYIIDNIKVVTPPEILTFPTTSFEAGETKWSVTGPTSKKEIVQTGAVDGVNALKVTATTRQTDWDKLTKLNVIPEGETWDMGTATMITAHITNENDYLVQVRVNLKDKAGNARMAYFSVQPKTNREIVIDAERIGTPGVKNESWKGDGYNGTGVDKSALTVVEFFISEPEAGVMKGILSPSYIIDNIRAK